MSALPYSNWLRPLPRVVAVTGLALLGFWLVHHPGRDLTPRLPGADRPTGVAAPAGGNPVLAGKVLPGPGQPAENLPGTWPGFRGPDRNHGPAPVTVPPARAWEGGAPRQLWSVELGEGYAGPAVWNGRVYLLDYNQTTKEDTLRCLSLADGREIWRFAYPMPLKRNHGLSRTVPAVAQGKVVSLGPKCHVACVDALSGTLYWGLDLVHDFGATVPPWYAGQCPLIDGDKVILAPGGPDALLLAVDLATGQVLWKTPNPHGWKMTHASITVGELAGRRQYVYPASHGVVGVDAADGRLLWETPDWKISIATIPSPVLLDGDRVFLAGGYDAGALMLRIVREGDRFVPEPLYRLKAATFGATQHTPVYFQGHLYGTRPDGRFTCLDPADGRVVWTSEPGLNFGLGAFLVAEGLAYVLTDNGRMVLMEASPTQYTPLARARILTGREAWGPMALVGGRLLARDLTRLVCLDVAAH